MRTPCFRYFLFRKTGSPSHNFFMVKNFLPDFKFYLSKLTNKFSPYGVMLILGLFSLRFCFFFFFLFFFLFVLFNAVRWLVVPCKPLLGGELNHKQTQTESAVFQFCEFPEFPKHHLFGLFSDNPHLSRDMTKPTKWVCAQRRLRSAWASAQSDQSLRCPHEESLGL